MEQSNQVALLRDRYTVALLTGDHREAARVVKDALDRGIEPVAIYVEVFRPAMAEVGNAWVGGELNIANGHLATSITLQQITYVRDARKRKPELGVTAVVACVEGEMHSVGTSVIGSLFQMEGWDVSVLGQDTPTDDLVELVRVRKPNLVMLSLALPDRIPVASRAVTLLKSLDDAPVVFVGGAGMSSHAGKGMPADLITSAPFDAIRMAGEILGLKEERPTLEDYLSALGRRVQALRKEHAWSQQQLAVRAGLDRTYVSAVEQGRQNITIGAAVKFADAFDMPLSELVSQAWDRLGMAERS
ncbi:MAG: helix-turn-helix domain-containing protein [Caldilineaceae bacterium SB0664_bin_22]|nr:helix-turn-helix domain-containing protein [Caldilineaceae bacterium SB0664_bin_22]